MRRAELLEAVERGVKFNYHFFWGGAFSQWLRSAFIIDGVTYRTAEHWMMAEKARTFNDQAALKRILSAIAPDEVKLIGRGVKNYDDTTWACLRYAVVLRGSMEKFGQNPSLGRILLATGDDVLVEASPFDRIWGIGRGEADPARLDPRLWRGDNLLGFALMQARELLRAMPGS